MILRTRQEKLDHLRQNPEVTVLIIGGGINGIGTFRDLALQDIDVYLVERGDFCSGASSASSHMVHGGLRYLENGEFRLVRESVKERNLLLRNAPHLVHPLPTTIPIFSRFSGTLNAPLKFFGLLDKSSERGTLIVKIGLLLYDLYTRAYRTMPFHQFWSRQKSLDTFPNLNPDIIATATYYDAAMPIPERIAIELLRDAEGDSDQVLALNYVSAVGSDGTTITLHDQVTGEEITIKPEIVVNAGGAWIDRINDSIGEKSQFVGGTKGSHLILDYPELRTAIADHEFYFENADGRAVLIYPLKDKVMVGTTDIPIDDPDSAECTEEEVDYLLGMVQRVFPSLKPDHSQIVYRFSGVRPLPPSDAESAGQISRDHQIKLTETARFPIYSLVGGKWTTFRAFSEQVTDRLLEHLGQKRQGSTETRPIGGGKDYPSDKNLWCKTLSKKTGLDPKRIDILFERYGTGAEQIAVFIAEADDQPLASLPDYSKREIMFLLRREYVVKLDDLLMRRTMLASLGEATEEAAQELRVILQEKIKS